MPVLRTFAAHPNASAALLFGAFVFVYLWPALIGGKVLSPTSVLYTVTPWQGYTPSDRFDYYNYLLADVPFAIYPWRQFARELIHSGVLPMWNPHVLAGVPFYTNPQTGLFTLFNLPLWVFSLDYGLNVSAALKLWAAGFGTYLLVRELRLGFLPGLLAGVGFAFCSLNISWLLPETLPGVAVMLPWMLWLIERLHRGGGIRTAIGLAGVTAIALGGGHPGTQVHVMFAAGLYTVLRTAFSSAEDAAHRWRAPALAFGGLATGGLLMAFMLVPEALSSRDTVGTLARRGGDSTLPGARMPLDMIRTVLLPDWWGRPSAVEAPVQPLMDLGEGRAIPINFLERTFYAGIVTCLLACIGLGWRGAWRRMAPFAILGFLGLALPLHLLGLRWVVDHLPVLGLVQNQRFHFVFELSLAVLAAYGLQALLDKPRELARFIAPGVAVVIGLVAFTSAPTAPGDVGRLVKHFLTGNQFEGGGIVALTSAVWLVFFASAVGLVLLAAWRWPHRSVAIATALVLLAAGDMLHFATGFNPMGPASKAIPPRTPAIAYLQRHDHEGRIVAVNLDLSTDWPMVYGLHDIRGYDPPYPTLSYFRLWRLANPEQVDWRPTTIAGIDETVIKVASILGVRNVLADAGVEVSPNLHALRRVYAGQDGTIFRNDFAAPRALVPSSVMVVPTADDARAALVADNFDPRRMVVVEQREPGAEGLKTSGSGSGSRSPGRVAITGEKNTRVTLHATMRRPGLVVLNEQLAAGWSVQVDGRDAAVVRVNQVMRGVAVGEGAHDVVWTYRVPGLRLGLLLSGLVLLALVGTGTGLVVRGVRSS